MLPAPVQLMGLFLPLLVIGGGLAFFRTAYGKGKLGEWGYALMLSLKLDRKVYRILNDISLRLPDGSTTQIDHIVVSRHGIFVIELKNYQGWIFGDEYSKTWTQSLNKHSRFSFQNPIRQNHRHVMALAELTGIPQHYFKPVVAFVGGCEIKTALPPNVGYTGAMINYIQSQKEILIQDEQVAEIAGVIEAWRRSSAVSHHEHVRNLRDRKQGEAVGKNKESRMKWFGFAGIALAVVVLVGLLIPEPENPYRQEMIELESEIASLHHNLRIAKNELIRENDRAAQLKQDNIRLEAETAQLRESLDRMTTQHDRLKQQWDRMTEREREEEERAKRLDAQRAETRRQEEAMRRQQIASIAAANQTTQSQPPFRIFDVIHVGQRRMQGQTDNYGRFSIRNYTDQPLRVNASQRWTSKTFIVPPNSASNSVWIRADKGDTLRVTANDHTEQHPW